MRISHCNKCGSKITEDDSNPAVHYSNPATICHRCETLDEPKYIQDAKGNYHANDALVEKLEVENKRYRESLLSASTYLHEGKPSMALMVIHKVMEPK
jgi:hypothetical protein